MAEEPALLPIEPVRYAAHEELNYGRVCSHLPL